MESEEERWEIKRVMSELSQGLELTNKLMIEMVNNSSSEASGILVDRIVSCYDNAISSLQNDSPLSPTCQVSDLDFKDHVNKKTRKNLLRWSNEQVHEGVDIHDGYNWRKYGQKHILGTTHPRSYYRCTHRYTQGCFATKQVQRGEDGPSSYRVGYRGKHTCVVVKQTKEKNDDIESGSEVEAQGLDSQIHVETPSPLLSEPTTDPLYFSMPPPSQSSHIGIEHDLLAEMNSNSACVPSFPDVDMDFLVDQMDLDSCLADYYSIDQGSPDTKM